MRTVRDSTKYVPWKDRKELCADLKRIYGSDTLDSAELALQTFEEKWNENYTMVGSFHIMFSFKAFKILSQAFPSP